MDSNKKKILFLIPTLGGGGAERVLVNLVNNLDKTKFDIVVQTIFKSGVHKAKLNNNIILKEGKFNQFRGNTYFLKLFSPKFLAKHLIKDYYDIVISYLEGPSARIVSGCKGVFDSKIVSWIHVEQLDIKSATHSFRSRKEAEDCYNSFDKTICVAETVKNDFLKLFPKVRNVNVLYNTNEDEIIKYNSLESIPDNILSDTINVFSVGRIVYEKGYDRLIRCHKKLIEEGLKHHIYILGSGGLLGQLNKLVQELQIEDTFHFLGFDPNPYKYISKGDIFICSSRREGFSTAVSEALILGLPTISTNCSGSHELLGKSNEYGLVVENSTDGIYKGLRSFLENTEIRVFYKKKALERGKMFSKEKTKQAVENMLNSL